MIRRAHLYSLDAPPASNTGAPPSGAEPVTDRERRPRPSALSAVTGHPTPAIVQALDTLSDSLAGLRDAVGTRPGFEEIQVGSFIVSRKKD